MLTYVLCDDAAINGNVHDETPIVFTAGTMDEILFNPEVWGYSSCRKAIIMGVMVAIQYVIAMFV